MQVYKKIQLNNKKDFPKKVHNKKSTTLLYQTSLGRSIGLCKNREENFMGYAQKKETSYESCHDNHVMICHDTCHEGINTPITCHDSNRLSKDEWWYLVDQLSQWKVYNPRAIVKKNPIAAWRCMNICKDNCVKVPGAYFTTCFRRECAKDESKKQISTLQKNLERKLGL